MSVDLARSRRSLPAVMLDRSSYSIFSVIKQAIGKDLTRFSIPVVWNEPLSFLQRLAECLEYSSLLDRAALATTTVERFHLITAFVVSTLSTHLERMSKPFNPLLSETFELKMEGSAPFHYIAEQVCHHPPISALHAQGQNWTLSANVEPKVKFHGTNVNAISEGRWILRMKRPLTMARSTSQSSFQSCDDDDEDKEKEDINGDEMEEEYTWETPTVLVHNIIFGRLWCEFQGQVNIEQVQSNKRSILIIKSPSWFSSQAVKLAELFKFTGYIFEGNDKLGAYHGNYGHCYYAVDTITDLPNKTSSHCSAGGHNCIHLNSNSLVSTPCDLLLSPTSRLIWHRILSGMNDNELALRSQYYFFTPFALALNELNDSSMKFPSTDCRYREDIRYLEKGQIDAASGEKHRLEEQQRAEARKREDEHQPLWFEKDSNDEYIYTHKYDQRLFDQCPDLFTQTSSQR